MSSYIPAALYSCELTGREIVNSTFMPGYRKRVCTCLGQYLAKARVHGNKSAASEKSHPIVQ